MNSTVSNDYSREHLALQAAICLKKIFASNQNIISLHKELLEINLTFTTFIEESKKLLETRKLELANKAKSSQQVAELLSKQSWYKQMIDDQRQNISLYLSDDATLEWFGRTIKTRKKVSSFLKNDMHCSRHDFTSIEPVDRIIRRDDARLNKDDGILASPISDDSLKSSSRKRTLQSNFSSPEYADGCYTDDVIERKRLKSFHNDAMPVDKDRTGLQISNKGDGLMGKRSKYKGMLSTPPFKELGQGDCMASTSGADSAKSHDTLNSQLPRLAVECNGYIEFIRMRNNRPVDAMKWERKCKVQISYSEDLINSGEYIIWAIRYSDESKCRRNLLAAFEEAAE